jgi:hypothetical protein
MAARAAASASARKAFGLAPVGQQFEFGFGLGLLRGAFFPRLARFLDLFSQTGGFFGICRSRSLLCPAGFFFQTLRFGSGLSGFAGLTLFPGFVGLGNDALDFFLFGSRLGRLGFRGLFRGDLFR